MGVRSVGQGLTRTREPTRDPVAGLKLLVASKFLATVGVFMLLFTVAGTLLYMEQGRIVEAAFSQEADRRAAFAAIDKWSNVVTLVAQLFLAGRLLQWLGPCGALLLLPLVYAVGFAAMTALQGAEVIFYPTAIGWHPKEKAEYGEAQHAAWETSMRGHAIANGTYIAGVNRTGHEVITGDGIEFFGGSFVADPFGWVVAKAGHHTEEVLVVTCDRKMMEDVRRNWPFFRDRRIDFYQGITKRVAD